MKFIFSLCILLSLNIFAASIPKGNDATPDPELTPGVLCTDQDDNFEKYDYDEQIPRCKRSVGHKEKLQIAAQYGHIEEDNWPDYEFDHLIPLCAGGSDGIQNIWPEPIQQAKEKDKVENAVCRAMRNGTMTQKQAVEKVMKFFETFRAN